MTRRMLTGMMERIGRLRLVVASPMGEGCCV